MSAAVAVGGRPTGRGSHPDVAIARRAFRQVWIGATLCAIAFGATSASSAISYVSSFPTEAARRQIALTTGRDAGLSVLLGPVSSIGTVGGYTFYKGFVFLTTIGALWALLATTRLLRGEEDAGRWQVVLAGSTRPARVTTATLGALGAAVGVVFLGTTAITLLAGRKPDLAFGTAETVLFGLSLAIPAAVFVGVGAVTSQLSRTRRSATGLGMVVFGVAFVLRMVADSSAGTRWLLWTTPFGWSERMRPLTDNNVGPLVPALVTVLVLGGVAVALASRRDVGDGLLASRDVARLRPFGLGSAFGLTVRRELAPLSGWLVGAFASGLMLGVIAKITTGSVPKSLDDTLDKFGVHGTLVQQYLGVAFLLVATIVALLPAGQVGAAADEETSGRLVHVLARATRRRDWFGGRLALAAAAVVLASLVAGLGTWFGAAVQHVDLGFWSMLGAGLNVAPIALVALGIGAVACAISPRRAGAAVYALVIWSIVIDLSASLVSGLHGLQYLSLFHYMALVPAHRADALQLTLVTVLAAVLCTGATIAFCRRDLKA
jgi:ABC-2 type transport system permease protein